MPGQPTPAASRRYRGTERQRSAARQAVVNNFGEVCATRLFRISNGVTFAKHCTYIVKRVGSWEHFCLWVNRASFDRCTDGCPGQTRRPGVISSDVIRVYQELKGLRGKGPLNVSQGSDSRTLPDPPRPLHPHQVQKTGCILDHHGLLLAKVVDTFQSTGRSIFRTQPSETPNPDAKSNDTQTAPLVLPSSTEISGNPRIDPGFPPSCHASPELTPIDPFRTPEVHSPRPARGPRCPDDELLLFADDAPSLFGSHDLRSPRPPYIPAVGNASLIHPSPSYSSSRDGPRLSTRQLAEDPDRALTSLVPRPLAWRQVTPLTRQPTPMRPTLHESSPLLHHPPRTSIPTPSTAGPALTPPAPRITIRRARKVSLRRRIFEKRAAQEGVSLPLVETAHQTRCFSTDDAAADRRRLR